MSTIDLMLLGVLMQKPMNAYEMKKEMEYRDIKDWIKISSPSVYKNLVKLYKSGYLDGEMVREGEMPEKTIYTINDKGKMYFMELMQYYSESPTRVYMDFCPVLTNLHNVDYETGLKMIETLQSNLTFGLECINREIERKSTDGVSLYGMSIIKLYSQMFALFCSWIDDFKKQYSEHSKTS